MNQLHEHLLSNAPWYAKWHEKPRSKIHAGILIVVLVAVALSLYSTSNRGIAQQYVMSDIEKMEFAERNNMRLLQEGDYAIAYDPNVKASKDKHFDSITMKNGDMVRQQYGDNLIANVIEYEAGKDTYVMKDDPNITVKNIYDFSGYEEGGKLEKAIGKKLKREGKVSVIVEMNLKEKKYYDKNDNASARAAKKQDFEQSKSSIVSAMGNGAKVKNDLQIINGISVEIKNEKALAALSKNSRVKRVTLDRPKQLLLEESVPMIHAPDVYGFVDQSGRALTGNGIRVAVIDTGVDYRHADLGGCFGPSCKVVGGYDFVYHDSDPMDDNGHGTHVAATVAGQGVLNGVAPDAKLYAYKVCAGSGCDGGAMIAAWNAAVDPNGDGDPSDHVDVATASIGGNCPIPLNEGCGPVDPFALTIDNATALGVISTIAAGNSGPSPSTVNSPGTSRTALTVAAACKTSQVGTSGTCSTPIASFSSRGPSIYNSENLGKPEIAAPGVNICAAKVGSSGGNCKDSAHYSLSGTSMATPHIAGVAALVKQANPTYTPSQIKQRIIDTATPLGGNLTANDQGAGLVNVAAAIPLVSEISSNPKLLRITTNPAVATYTTTQNFTSTGMNVTVGTVTVEFTSPVPGITFSSSKQTLNLSNLASDSFTATFSVDNNTVKPGSYPAAVLFTQNGVRKGAIPVQIVVTPTVTANAEVVSYGNFDPTLSSWQSNTMSIVYTNKRTDVSQTLSLSSTPFAAGITYQFSPATITIPAGGSVTVSSNFSAVGTIGQGTYSGQLIATNAASDVKVIVKFTKLHVLEITDTSGATALSGALVGMDSRDGSFRVFGSVPGNPFTLSLPGATLVDVWIRYADQSPGYIVVREGVSVSGTTRISISKTEAKNLVKVIGTDKDGQNRQVGYKLFTLLDAATGRMRISTIWNFVGDVYVSNISNASSLAIATIPQQTSAQTIYFYGGEKTGLTSNWTITNTAADLKKIEFFNHNNIPGQLYNPAIYSCIAPNSYDCVAYGFDATQAGVYRDPSVQVAYSTRPKNFYIMQNSNNAACETVQGPCQQEFWSPSVDTFTGIRKTWGPATESLAWPDSGKVYNGLAPQILFTTVRNASDAIYLSTVYPGGFVSLRQDFALPPPIELIYTLKKNGSVIRTGGLGEGLACHSAGFCFASQLNAAEPGQFEVTVPYAYKAQGLSMNATFKQTFDTTKSDTEPPYASAIFFYSGAQRSEVYDPGKTNKIVAHLSPGGGSLQGVTFSYSTNGTSFTPFASSASEGVYTANIPQLPTAPKAMFRIAATDTAGNTYEFTFELPQGTASDQTDTQQPTATITAPADGTTVTGTFTITATASDDVGVTKVEFYQKSAYLGPDPVLIGTDTTAPYSYALNPWLGWPTNDTRELTVKAYDASGKVGTSGAVGVIAATVPPTGDTTPPTVSLTAPANGATVSGTVSMNASASDNVGVTRVEFYAGANLLGTDTSAPYSVAWNTSSVTNGSYALTARAYDAAANSKTSSTVSVTVNNAVTPPPSDTTPPTVSLTAPSNGATVTGVTTISASASDNVGVDHVDFYRGTTLIGADATAPYTLSWDTTTSANGSYSLTARAFDAAGNNKTSSAVTVTVNNGVTPPPPSDTTPPTVSLTAPAAGAVVSGSVTVSAAASDNIGVTKVSFYRDGTLIDTDTTASEGTYAITWKVSKAKNKTYVLTAKAFDAAGNVTTSAPVQVKSN